MRFLYYTDVHLSGQTPEKRIDDYQKSIVYKLEEIYKKAKDLDADFLVCGGDMFNSHRIFNYELLSEVMDIFSSGLKTYLAIGQHDIAGYNPTTYKSSTLAFVVKRCPNLQVLWEPIQLNDVTLYASHVWEDPMDACKQDFNSETFNILVAHYLFTNKAQMFENVNTTKFCDTMRKGGGDYDLVLSGDLHDGYETHEVDRMWFCNPASLARKSITDSFRMPKYAVIDIPEKGGIPIIDLVEVECALPGNEVFAESLVELARERKEFNPDAFISGIEDFEIESADIYDLIRKVGISKNIRKEVMQYLATKSGKS
jgi:hypothetical protein